MSNVEIRHKENGETRETEISDPGFVDVLLNVNEVSVDGRVFTKVTQVSYKE